MGAEAVGEGWAVMKAVARRVAAMAVVAMAVAATATVVMVGVVVEVASMRCPPQASWFRRSSTLGAALRQSVFPVALCTNHLGRSVGWG